MKRVLLIILFIILLLILLLGYFKYCKPTPPVTTLSFSGTVVDTKGNILDSVSVELQGNVATSDKEGNFKIDVKQKDPRYVLSFVKKGYGLVSRIFLDTASNLRIKLTKATMIKVDINTVVGDSIIVTDVNAVFSTPLSAQNPAPVNPLAEVPFVYDGDGRLIGFEMPPTIAATYAAVNNFRPPVRGARIAIPKKGLALAANNTQVEIAVQTIDLYSPDGMPGDYSVRIERERRGAMKTYGAANIDIYQGDKLVQLQKGFEAKISIPVDTLSILTNEKLNDEIPLLIYDKTTGDWHQEGVAKLDKRSMEYVGAVSHFSTFNMDMVFTNQACYKICNTISAATFPNQQMEISIPSKMKLLPVGPSACAGNGGCTTGSAYAIINLERFTPVGIRMFNNTTLLSTNVFVAGDAAANQNCDYNSCSGPVVVTSTDPKFVFTSNAGMCRSKLAIPQIVSRNMGASTGRIKLSWIYKNNFTTPAATAFTVEAAPDDSFSIGVVATAVAASTNLLHTVEIDKPYGTYYFRITGADISNVVCIVFDATTQDLSCNNTAPIPADCF